MIDFSEQQQTVDAASDRQLLAQIQRRDEQGLSRAIELYAGQVKATCQRICIDELEADEVVSLVFWELWHSIEKFDSRRGSLRSYLLTLARSRAIDRQRAAAARTRHSQKYFEAHAQHASGWLIEASGCASQLDKERNAVLRAALADLPKAQQSALELAFFDGLTHREVAERQELPLGTIKTNIRRGLIQLRKKMNEYACQERELT